MGDIRMSEMTSYCDFDLCFSAARGNVRQVEPARRRRPA